MHRRKSSLYYGSRTRQNVLQGKTVRKYSDGTDVFADYWTESDDESSSSLSSQEVSKPFLQMKQTSNPSDVNLVTSKQIVTTQDSYSQNEAKYLKKQDQRKYKKFRFKFHKNDIVSSDENLNKSPTKKQKLPQGLQLDIQNEFSRSFDNKGCTSNNVNILYEKDSESSNIFSHSLSNITNKKKKTSKNVQSAKRLNENECDESPCSSQEEYNESNISQHSTSKTYATRRHFKNTAVSPLSKTISKKKKILTSKNTQRKNSLDVYDESSIISEEKCNEKSVAQHSTSKRYATRGHFKNTSLSSKTSGKDIKALTSKIPQNKKSFNENDYDESSSISQQLMLDDNATSTKDRVSSLSKKIEKRKRVLTQNIQNTNLNTSDIHILSRTKLIHNETCEINRTELEANDYPVSEKMSNESNNSVGFRNALVPNTYSISLEKSKIRKIGDSLHMSKTFAQYDEYDEEILSMMNENEKNKFFVSPINECSSSKNVILDNNKRETELNTSKRNLKSSKEVVINDNKSQNLNNTRSSNRSLPENYQKTTRLLTRSLQNNSKIQDSISTDLPEKNVISELENSQNSELERNSENILENTLQHTSEQNSPIENDFAICSMQNLGNSSDDNAINEQEIAENPSLITKKCLPKSTLKRKSILISPPSKIHISTIENQNSSHPPLKASENFCVTNKNAAQIDKINEVITNFDDNMDACANATFVNGQVLESSRDPITTAAKISKVNNLATSSVGNRNQEHVDKSIEIISGEDNNDQLKVSQSKKRRRKNAHYALSNTSAVEISKVNNLTTSSVGNRNQERVDKSNGIISGEDNNEQLKVSQSKRRRRKNADYALSNTNAAEISEVNNLATSSIGNRNQEHVDESNEIISGEDNNDQLNVSQSKRRGRKNADYALSNTNAAEISEINNLATLSIGNRNQEHVDKSNEIISSEDNNDQLKLSQSKRRGRKSADYALSNTSAAEISIINNEPTSSNSNRSQEHVDKCNEIISSGNGQLSLSQRSKRGRKNIPVCTSNSTNVLRRSQRNKFPPLAYWRNERLQYRVENGIINFVGVDQGTREDDAAVQTLLHRLDKKKTKIIKEEKPKKFRLQDVIQEKKFSVHLLKKFNNIPWEDQFQNCPYAIKRVVQTNNSAVGFVQIEIGAEKPLQYMPNDDLYLIVLKGKVQVSVQDNITTLEEKDLIIIPRCMPYNIKNIGDKKALLTFCVGQFKYLENLP